MLEMLEKSFLKSSLRTWILIKLETSKEKEEALLIHLIN